MSKNSCLQVNINDTTTRIQAHINRITDSINSNIYPINNKLSLKCLKLNNSIEFKVNLNESTLIVDIKDVYKNKHLKFNCGIVCSVSEVKYLKVSPEEVCWITPEYGIIYEVESNTDWIII